MREAKEGDKVIFHLTHGSDFPKVRGKILWFNIEHTEAFIEHEVCFIYGSWNTECWADVDDLTLDIETIRCEKLKELGI